MKPNRFAVFFASSLITACLMSSVAQAKEDTHHTSHWSYEGDTGPEHWGSLDSSFKLCSTGTTQSPINVIPSLTDTSPALSINYHPSTMMITNNGHTIQLSPETQSEITLDGKPYKLVQFHLHTPSEERINGTRYDLSMHLVHQNADQQLAVIAVVFQIGEHNAALEQFFNEFPNTEHGTANSTQKINPAQFLPEDMTFFNFMGSLTTPPCSEGVTWLVMKQALTLSNEQLEKFKRLYPMNARPEQPLHDRQIREVSAD